MRILAADDETLSLELLTDCILEILPDAQIQAFSKPSQLISYAQNNTFNIAFLDINMRGTSGIDLAKSLKSLNPHVNIIFVTGYNEYTADAMMLHASGYITKPVTPEKIKDEIDDLRHPVKREAPKLLNIRCFGNFEAYTPDGEVLHFDRSKSKEVLAYLIYREGASCTTREIASTLFEDTEYDNSQRGYMQKIVSSMISSLKKAGAESIIAKNYNSIAVDTRLVNCDFYNVSDNNSEFRNSYRGEFMAQYSWAEFVSGYLENIFWDNDSKRV